MDLEIGDRVVDRESEDPDVMRVIEVNVGRADSVTIQDLGKTVQELNPNYPSDDEVVKTVYEQWLDSYVPKWDEWNTTNLDENLSSYAEKWSISTRSYLYPRRRLKRL